MNAFEIALSRVGGPTEMARRIGSSVQAVCNWRVRGVPVEKCPDVERACDGVVRCEELRPGVNWTYLRGTSRAGKHHESASQAS